jgi:RNA polymerase sporulation-specific sigma factor
MNNKYLEMSDEEIAILAANGDNNATDFLLGKYRNFVLAIARSYFLIGADHEDIIQEGMIGLFKAIRDYKNGESVFSTFAHMCIKRQIITAIKSANRKKHLPLNTYISLNKTVYDDEQETTLLNILSDVNELTPEGIYIEKEGLNGTKSCIYSVLSSYEAEVLEKYLCGKSYSDIANELGKTEKSIDNALQRIKKKIENIHKK